MLEYEKLLERGLSKVPKERGSGERFEMPSLRVMRAGSRTVIMNFVDVADSLRREPQHLLKYLLKELATSGEMSGKKLEVLGNFTEEAVNRKLESYVKTYVLCRECGKPDTRLVKENRVQFVKCEACGARHPVAKV